MFDALFIPGGAESIKTGIDWCLEMYQIALLKVFRLAVQRQNLQSRQPLVQFQHAMATVISCPDGYSLAPSIINVSTALN
jgi:hypothetical protein